MKDKFKNLKNKKLLIFAVIVCAIAVLVFSTKEQLFKTNSLQTEDNKETISIKDANGKVHTKLENLNPSIKGTTNGTFKLNGKDIVKNAAIFLGDKYGEPDNKVVKGANLDCSQLVQSALVKSGVNNISGFQILDGHGKNIPEQTMDWFVNGNGAKQAWSQLKYWKYDTSTQKIVDIPYNKSNSDTYSIYKYKDKLTVDGQKINVLKVNDPITSNLRYYQYYDGTTKRELPMGTIIISYGSQWRSGDWSTGKQNHAWICIGNLGTTNANEAANILINMGIIEEKNRGHVVSTSSTNKYWRIENAGSTGVTINNGDPDMSLDGTGKKIGPIWAFQVANDNIGTISFGVNKVSSRNSNKKVNATFKYKLTTQDGNSSIKNGQIVANSGNKVTISNLERGKSYRLYLEEQKVTGYEAKFDGNSYATISIDNSGKVTWGKIKDSDGKEYGVTVNGLEGIFNLKDNPEPREISLDITKINTDNKNVNATFQYWVSDTYETKVLSGNPTEFNTGSIPKLFTAYYDETTTKYVYFKESKVDGYSKGYFQNKNNYIVAKITVSPTLSVKIDYPDTNKTYKLQKSGSKFVPATEKTNYVKEVKLDGTSLKATIVDPDSIDVKLNLTKLFYSDLEGISFSSSGINVDYWFSDKESYRPGNENAILNGQMSISTKGTENSPSISVKKNNDVYIWIRENLDDSNKLIMTSGIFDDESVYIYAKVHIDKDGKATLSSVSSSYIVQYNKNSNTLTPISENSDKNKFMKNGEEKGKYISEIALEQNGNWNEATLKAKILDPLNSKEYGLYFGKSSTADITNISEDIEKKDPITENDTLEEYNRIKDSLVSGAKFKYISGWTDYAGNIYTDDYKKMENPNSLYDFIKLFPANKEITSGDELKLIDQQNVALDKAMISTRFFVFHEEPLDGYKSNEDSLILFEFAFEWQDLGIDSESNLKIKGTRMARITLNNSPYGKETDANGVSGTDFFYNSFMPAIVHNVLRNLKEYKELGCFSQGGFRKYKYLTDSGNYNVDKGTLDTGITFSGSYNDWSPDNELTADGHYVLFWLIGAGNYGNAIKDPQFEDESRYNFYQYVVNSFGAAIILPTTNTLIFSIANDAIKGNYEIDIAKVGNIDDVNNKEKYIGGVKFTGNSITDKTTSDIDITTEREEKAIDITTKHGALTKINNTVIIRNETVSDIYELQEGDPPNGFTKYEHKIKLEITKEVYSYGNLEKKNRIKDIYAYIDINDDNKYDENDGEYYKKLVWSSGESIETILDDHIYINVESQKGDNVEQKIIFIVKDDEIPSGQYQMNIVKKSLTDTQKDNYASTEATYQNALASAVYSVTKKINNGSENTSSVTTKASEIQNITGGMVTINDVDKTDHYVIKETKASLGLNKSLDGTELGITIKKRLNTDTNKYEIDYITATFTGIDGEEYLTPGETLYLKSKYSSKSYFKDYVVAIQLKQNAGDSGDITVTWRNEIPTWGINLIKVNEEGDLIKDKQAKFSIGLYEDKNCQTEIDKISDKDGNEISKINSTINGVINLENIKIPQNFINRSASSKTYYLKITEIEAPTDYIKNSSPLVIPIEFTLSSSGQYNVNVIKSNAFVLVGSNKVGYENLGIKINFDVNELSITYPNEPEKFSLYIAKVDENDQYVPGVEFNVNGKGGYVTASENSEAGSKGTVLVVDGEVVPQSTDKTFKYEISEVSVGNNDLIKLKDSITVYVKTKNNGTKWTINSVSFNENSVVDSIQVSLENNVKVTAKIERSGNIITVKVPNTKTEPGKYQLKLRKVNSSDNNSPVSGVTFSVKDGANTAKDYTTNSQGLASVFDSNNAKTINEDNVDTPDTYTITEVKLPKNSNLVKLSESVEFVVNKKFDADSNTYYVDSATFKDGTTRKQVSLQNGKKATVSIAVKDNIVTVTVPNEMKGSFEFNLIKYIKGTTTPLAGAKFNITINDGSKDIYKNTASLITNSKGKITIPSDKLNIESVGKTYRITINETEAPTGYTPIGIVTFTATSIKSGDEYVLKAEQKSDDNNCAKNVVITNKAINVEVENTPKNGTYNIRLIKKDQNGTRINETAKFRISYGYWDDNSFNEGVFHLYPAYVFLNSSSEKSAIWSDNGKELSTKNGIISVKNIKIDKDQIGERYYWVLEETDEPNGYVKYNGKIIIPVEFVEEGNSLIVKDVSSETCVIRNGQKLSLQDAGITFDEKTQTFEFEVKNTKETDEGGYSVELVKRGRTSSEDTTTKQLGGFKFNLIGATVDGSPLKDIKGNEYSKNNPYVISTNESVASKIWTVNDMDLNNIGTDDKYTLKEDEAYNNSGYYCGIKDEINLTVHKKSEKDGSVTYKSVESATLTVGSDSVTVSATEPTKTITKTVNDVRLQIIIALEKVGNTEKRIKITVENPKLKGSFGLKVIKTANGSQPLAGAVFDIKVTDNVTNKVLAEQTGATSDKNGLITLNKSIDIEDEGKMYKIDVVETKAPPGYQISEATKTFYVRSKLNDEKNGYILENEDHGDYVIENNLVTVKENNISVGKFGLHVHKYGKQNNGSGKPIANAVFDITINRGDEVVYKSPKSGDITNARGKIEILSDADGNEISMVEGEVFTVNIKETSAPVGYSIPDEFAGNGKTLTATVVRDTDGNLVLQVGNKIYANAILEVIVTENEKNQKGSYMLNLVKLGVNEDGTTTQLGGVTFNMIKASLNGYDNVETLYDGKYVNVSEQHPHVITTSATSPTPIWGDNNTGKINITKQDFDNDDTDSYTLVESNTGDNEDYYKGLSEKIKIDITRSTVVQSQNVLHYVKRVSLTIGSETRSIDIASNELISNEKYKEIVITKNIDGQDIDIKVRITKGTTDATSIQLIVENPHRIEGKYKISLLKYGVDADGVRTSQPLGGVTFGRVMTQKTSQGTAEEKVNDTIVTSDKSAVCISNINGLSDSDGYISTEKGDKVDNYTLTEKSIGDNTDYEIGLTDPIQLEVRKGVTSYQNHVKSSYFASVLLTIGKEQRYINVLNGDDTEQTITLTNKDGKMFNVTIKVENNTETNVADIVVEVENPSGPIIFTFDLKKYVKNVNPNQIVANAQFKISIINKETKRAVTDENGKFINGTRLYTVDENGEIIIKGMEIDSVGTVYEVTLSEYSVPKGLTKMDSVIKFEIEAETNKKVKIVDNSFGLYKLKNGSYTLVDKNDKEYSLVRKIGVSESETGTSVVEVIMDNTAEYQFRIIKRNAAKTAVSGSRFTVIRENTDGTLTPILTDQPSQVLTEKPDKPGVYKYNITETATPPNSDTGLPGAQYINVLRGKFFKVYLKYEANGNLTVVNKYSNPENNYYELYEGEVSNPKSGVKINSDYLKDYVSVSISNVYSSKFEKELDIDIVNPISYGLNITKLNADISGNSTLQNAEFKVRREVAMTNGNTAIGTNEKKFESIATSSTEVIESAMFAGKYIYYITETKAPNSKFTNILENQYIKLYVIVDGDGRVRLANSNWVETTGYFEWYKGNIDDPKSTDEKVTTNGPMGMFVNVNVSESDHVYTINFNVYDPVKLAFKIYKKDATSNTRLKDINFQIENYTWWGCGKKEFTTDEDGTITYEADKVPAGIYEYNVSELESDNEIFNNLFKDYKIKIFMKISGDGSIKFVSDKNGTEFSSTVPSDKYFHIYKGDVLADNKAKHLINLISLKTEAGEIPTVALKVSNTKKYKINLIKKDSNDKELTGALFEVKRNSEKVFDGEVTDKVEVSEDGILPGEYEYYITEKSITNNKGIYVNVFKDKAIKLSLTVDKNGAISLKENNGLKFQVCSINKDGSYNVLDKSDVAYKFVKDISIVKDANEVSVVNVEVENPTRYNFNIIKKNAAETDVNGSKFTAYREDSDGNVTQVLNNEELKIINETPMRAGNYIYYITENSTPTNNNSKPGAQYVNVLEGKYMKVYVHLDANGRLSITNSKFQVADNYYEIYKGDISKRDGTKVENSEFISVNVSGPQNNVYTLNVVVTNPVKINTNIIKKDTSNNDLASSHFKVRRQDVSTKTFSDRFEGEVTSGIEKTESPMRAGNYIYYVTEKSSPSARYTNILEKTYLKIYVKISGDGKVVITDSKFNESAGYYEWYNGDINNPKDSDTKIDKSDPRNQYIKDISTSVEDSIYTVNVTVVNPVKIRVNVNKKIFGDDEVNLQNVEIKAETPDGFTGVVTKVTDKDGNISFIDQYANAGLRRYLVTEAKPAGEEFVNVLAHKEILVYTIVKADGTFQIVDEDGVPTENKWYAYNNTDSNNKVKLNENTDVIKNFVKVSQSVGKDGISELNFAIKNPQKYKLHLRKIDKDNKKGMNGVTFDLSVSDGKNIVKLRNANTLENMNTEGLVTSTVDGADGVIEINDILIEKSGTYTYTLHEHSTDGIFDWLYKNHKDDIILRIKIVVRDGKYVIENLETVQGGDYVGDLSIGTGIGSTIKNERIKGKYDLILNKVDSYTEKALDGAVFNIHVEKDGKEHTLYKSTEDVDSMEQILPVDNVVVKDGKLEIKDIRIEEIGRDRLEEYTIVLTEVTAPKGYMLLDAPIKLKVTTNTTGKFDDEKYIVESVELVDDENHGLVTFDYNENKIVVTAKNEYFDLALRKSITSVAYPDTNEGEITEEETKDRIPEVITDGINEGPNGEDPTETTAVYNHKKNPVRAYKEQEVIYTLRVYNEGEIDGYAEEITDHLPEWLEFVDDDFNKERGWSLDENDETGRTVRTKNLSKAYADENGVDNLIKAKNKVTGDLDSKEIQIKCRVSEKAKLKTVLTNIAEISLSKADDRTSETVDRDSVTNNVKIPETSEEMSKYKDDELNKTYVPGQEDDDDFEKVIVEAFDLSLRKYITAVNDEQMLKDNTDTEDKKQNTQDKNNESTKDENSENTEDKNKVTNDESTNNETTKNEGQEKTDDSQEGNNNDEEQKDTVDDNSADLKYAREPLINIKDLRDKPDDVTTATYTHTKEPVEVSVDDIVTYTISVYNEGTVSGYASLIKDDIPEGLEYVKDSEINKKFNWKLLDENNKETDDVKKAKYIVSDYLSKENGDDNILNAFNGEKLDTKYVQVDFKVICKQDWAKIIKNEAQISDDQDDRGKPVRDRDSTPNEWKGEDDEDVEYIRVTYMDLALRKFITGVNKQIITDRIPEVDATALKNKENTTADYKHTKEPVIVHTNDTVIYTIRVYNEGSKDGYATQIKDDIPEGLEFIPYNETNKMYEWKMLDAEGKETLDVSKVKSVVTNYCSKDKETEKRQNLMLAFERPDGTTFDTPEYKDVKIAFKVVEPTTSDRILINHAQISEQTDKKGIHREDRDSTPNEWKGEDDEDIEKVRVLYFDLALRKWVTNTMVTENGQTFVTETGHHAEDDPEEVVKVDLKKSKINSVVVKFEYKVRITNEGEIAGYAKEIKDRIPDGLEFEEADNPNWKMLEDGTVVTDELKDKLLQPGESAEVIIVLKWINSPTNLGVKINFAEISKDHNDYGTPDIDSTPNNNVPGEDDIDDAPVMLTVKTGSQDLKYMLAILVVLTALVGSVSLLKKNLQKNKYN